MLIQLRILDSIMGFWAYMMEKISGVVGIYYQLSNNDILLLHHLSNRHAFLDLDLDKVQSSINLSHLYFLLNLYNTLIQPNRQRFITPVIVLAIMTCFFSDTDSLGQKAHTSCIFSFFCNEMVVVIYSMLADVIKDLASR